MAVSAVVESAAQIVVPSELSASVGQAVEALLFCMTVSFAMGEMPPKNGGWRFHGTLRYSRVGTVAAGGFCFFVAPES
jgi:hypothetical protein